MNKTINKIHANILMDFLNPMLPKGRRKIKIIHACSDFSVCNLIGVVNKDNEWRITSQYMHSINYGCVHYQMSTDVHKAYIELLYVATDRLVGVHGIGKFIEKLY